MIGIISTLKKGLLPIELKESEENGDIENHDLHINSVAVFVGMDTYRFEFLLDLFSGNPKRIFKHNSLNIYQLSPDRIASISDIISTNWINTKKLGKKWLKYNNLVEEGKGSLRNFCRKFSIPYGFIELLDHTRKMDLTAASHSGQHYRKMIHIYISHLLEILNKEREPLYKYWEEFNEGDFRSEGVEEDFKLFEEYGDPKAKLISNLLSSFMSLLKGGEKELRSLNIGDEGVKVFNSILKYIIQPDLLRFIKIIWTIGEVIPFMVDKGNHPANSLVYPHENAQGQGLHHKGIVYIYIYIYI